MPRLDGLLQLNRNNLLMLPVQINDNRGPASARRPALRARGADLRTTGRRSTSRAA